MLSLTGKRLVISTGAFFYCGAPLLICDDTKKEEVAKLIAIVREPSANFRVSVVNKQFGCTVQKNGDVVLSSKKKVSKRN